MPSSGSEVLSKKAQVDRASFGWDPGSDTGQCHLSVNAYFPSFLAFLGLYVEMRELGIHSPRTYRAGKCAS